MDLTSEGQLDAELHAQKRPAVPPNCAAAVGEPAGYRDLMNDCWTHVPTSRPT
jgi:hypothetical protein